MQAERYLAIDYGMKRIGIAISDPLNIFGYPLKTLVNNKNFYKELEKLVKEYQITKIILGYPTRDDNIKSDLMIRIEELKKCLEGALKLPIEYYDEIYSSKLASQNILESVSSKKKRQNKGLVDMHAAAIILNDYIKFTAK
ncbi:MAG: Holliday junction resolvase RuvX [Ignavibacteriales bacterium]|nr:Holliday junction resolvase RuvX [Ignavibacteriales bacterium]